ncbi:hypothetical protein T03_2154 [Trichinella britovi]|uniref:Uncharacterized protein n=1 Tax=Trichinella britovi TaxID=45882 RepID=A0A0V0YY53_TRIBR|nr:hypothetical protein T03_2154 [Trichinella britovi]
MDTKPRSISVNVLWNSGTLSVWDSEFLSQSFIWHLRVRRCRR